MKFESFFMRLFFSLFILFFPILSFTEQKKVLIYFYGLGEYQWAKRLEKAFQSKDFTVKLHNGNPLDYDSGMKSIEKETLETVDLDKLEKTFNPNLILELVQSAASTQHPNRWLIFHDPWRFDAFLKTGSKLNYHGLIIPFETENHSDLKKSYKLIEGYPSHHLTSFKKLNYNHLFFCGFLWDEKRHSKMIKRVFYELTERKALSVYGPEKKWKFLKTGYKGYLPFEADSILVATQKEGVSLILHSDQHLNAGIPTARIFEAAAASSVIISDEHPFIKKHFGDTVLYINPNLKSAELTKAILKHYEWVLKNPIEAQNKARKAHEIFCEKFALETLIDKIVSEAFK